MGSNLAARLTEYDSDVTILTKSTEKSKNVREISFPLNIVVGNLTNKAAVRKLVKDKDYIFHLAAQTSRIASMKSPLVDVASNVKGTMTLLEACRDETSHAAIASVGSVTQVGKTDKKVVDEHRFPQPLTIYDADKLTCERYFNIYHEAHGLHTVFLRLSTLYGERQQITSTQTGAVNFFIGRALQGKSIEIFGTPSYLRDFLYVENVVDALLFSTSSKNTKGEVYQICSGKSIPFIEMIEQITLEVKSQTGQKTSLLYRNWPEDWKMVDPGDFVGTFKKFNRATGWLPKIGFKEGIRRTVSFYKENLKEYA